MALSASGRRRLLQPRCQIASSTIQWPQTWFDYKSTVMSPFHPTRQINWHVHFRRCRSQQQMTFILYTSYVLSWALLSLRPAPIFSSSPAHSVRIPVCRKMRLPPRHIKLTEICVFHPYYQQICGIHVILSTTTPSKTTKRHTETRQTLKLF